MSLPFDLKYRPRLFRDVLGNSGIVKLLLNKSINNNLHGRSMMFGGSKGCGKTTLSRIVSRSINCIQTVKGEPCLVCDGCKSVDQDSSFSYDEFDAATQGSVEKIREILLDVEYGTLDGKPRVVVFDEAHRLSKPSQDALLRPMEDRRLLIIFCTTEPHTIRSAIRDRVEEYPISHPGLEEILKRLKEVCEYEDIKYEDDALRKLIEINKLNPRTSLTGLQSISSIGDINFESIGSVYRFDSKERIVRVLELLDCNLQGAFKELEKLFQNEGSMWVRDEIISAISESIRGANGGKFVNARARSFYTIRGIRWADVAKDLALLDRPDAADVECVLLSSVQVARSVNHVLSHNMIVTADMNPNVDVSLGGNGGAGPPTPITFATPIHEKPVYVEPTRSKVIENHVKVDNKKEEPYLKTIEVDGVRFSKNEELTTLDGKIGKGSGSRPPASQDSDPESPRVQQDPRMIPISEKEFAREFIKGSKRL